MPSSACDGSQATRGADPGTGPRKSGHENPLGQALPPAQSWLAADWTGDNQWPAPQMYKLQGVAGSSGIAAGLSVPSPAFFECRGTILPATAVAGRYAAG